MKHQVKLGSEASSGVGQIVERQAVIILFTKSSRRLRRRSLLRAAAPRPREARIDKGLGKHVPGLEVDGVDGAAGFHAIEHDRED
ncbi:MAG TPA: hypothetical protein VFD47_07995, partial [Actinomycetota bacterium]|nr:hypothetical protein [Actinomycetota bacterium]